jgi:biotin carboxyl carrier protein
MTLELGESLSIDERLVIAPCEGRFHLAAAQHYTAEGEYVLEEQIVGHITGRNGDDVPVFAQCSGWVMSYLVREGFPVRAGEPVLCLRRL